MTQLLNLTDFQSKHELLRRLGVPLPVDLPGSSSAIGWDAAHKLAPGDRVYIIAEFEGQKLTPYLVRVVGVQQDLADPQKVEYVGEIISETRAGGYGYAFTFEPKHVAGRG